MAVALIAAAVGGCASVRHQYWDDRVHFTADFDNVAGLYVGNEVSVLGLPMGQVDALEARGRYVTVSMSLSRKVRVPADAIAALVSPQLITNRHVELTPPYAGSGPVLADGAHIPLRRTRTPVELDRILATFDQLGATLKGDNTTGPLASRVLFPMLDGNGDKLRETLDALSAAFSVTVANKDQISSTIVKLNDITAMVAGNDETVRNFSAQLTALMKLTADQAPGLRAVLHQLEAFVANTSAVVRQHAAQLNGALIRFTAITSQMRRNARNITEIVDVGPLMMQNVSKAVSREERALRLHGLLDKSVLDGEALALFCERIQMRSDGCRTGRIADMGPDLGLTSALLGLTK
ncbi:MAG: MCE family protein [Mycobacteriaceae bacterium]|nr:MCE family protein [Mycobacteriaceae bacterium]